MRESPKSQSPIQMLTIHVRLHTCEGPKPPETLHRYTASQRLHNLKLVREHVIHRQRRGGSSCAGVRRSEVPKGRADPLHSLRLKVLKA